MNGESFGRPPVAVVAGPMILGGALQVLSWQVLAVSERLAPSGTPPDLGVLYGLVFFAILGATMILLGLRHLKVRTTSVTPPFLGIVLTSVGGLVFFGPLVLRVAALPAASYLLAVTLAARSGASSKV